MTENQSDSAEQRRNRRAVSRKAAHIARQAIADVDDSGAKSDGKHLGASIIAPGVATHRFEAQLEGYRGWEWHVVIAIAAGSLYITVSEVALVSGNQALQAPDWVPYEDRIRPGDLGPRDLMPVAADDERLTTDETGTRHLSSEGQRQTSHRWEDGETGPESLFAKEALEHCQSCAFQVPLSGPLGKEWEVCVNKWAFDGTVVHQDHGCGAHSATPEEES